MQRQTNPRGRHRSQRQNRIGGLERCIVLDLVDQVDLVFGDAGCFSAAIDSLHLIGIAASYGMKKAKKKPTRRLA